MRLSTSAMIAAICTILLAQSLHQRPPAMRLASHGQRRRVRFKSMSAATSSQSEVQEPQLSVSPMAR
jgi:hypothetical protein